jgi:hypothetical protein
MPVFDDVLGLVRPPIDPNDYTNLRIQPIILAPPDVNTEELESDSVGRLPEVPVTEVIDEFVPLPENTEYDESTDFDIEYSPASDPLEAGEVLSVVPLPSDVVITYTDSTDPSLPTGSVIDPLDPTVMVVPPASTIDPLDPTSLVNLPPDTNADTPSPDFVNPPSDTSVFSFEDDAVSSTLSGIGYVPAPNGVNWGNTIIDQIFTGANQIFDFLGLPFPEALNDLYQITQTIEGFIEDPRMLLGQVKEAALGFLFPRGMESMWDDALGIIKAPPDSRYDVANGVYTSNQDTQDFSLLGEEVKDKERLNSIVEDIGKSQFAFQGRKSVVGMTMRLNHLWDIKVQVYKHQGRTYVPDMGVAESSFYKKTNKEGEVVNQGHKDRGTTEAYRDPENKAVISDFEDSMPILSYDLDFKSLASKDVELFGGSSIAIPEIIRRSSHLSMQVMDDENKRWRRWFQRYIESMYDEDNNVVKPYKTCCVKITIYQYRTDLLVLSHKVFLAVLKNYQVLSSGSGSGSGNADIIDTEWSIVGEMDIKGRNDELNII